MRLFTFPPSYYQILGIPKTSSQKEIKVAFNKLIFKFHPDRNPGNPEAEEKTKELIEIKEVLLDYPALKHSYDQQLEEFEREEQRKASSRAKRHQSTRGNHRQSSRSVNDYSNAELWILVISGVIEIFKEWDKYNRKR